MKKYIYPLLFPLGMFVIVMAFAQALNAAVCWVPPTERQDNTPLALIEIAGYKIYLGDTSGGPYTQSLQVNDGTATCYDYQTPTDKYGVMTTVDTDGREGGYSNETFIAGSEVIPIVRANAINDLTVTQVPGTYDYVFKWTNPTTDINGDLLPEGAIRKVYLFDNDAWVMDINSGTTITLPLTITDHEFEMEVETVVNGVTNASYRSPIVAVKVARIITPIMPPSDITYTLPEGYRTIRITPIR